VAPLLPTAVKMVVIRPEGVGPPRLEPARCPAGAKPASDRLAFGADHGSDALEGEAGGFQTSRFLVTRLPSRKASCPRRSAAVGLTVSGGVLATSAAGATASSAICLVTR
jgi:hypothetical protein